MLAFKIFGIIIISLVLLIIFSCLYAIYVILKAGPFYGSGPNEKVQTPETAVAILSNKKSKTTINNKEVKNAS